MDADTPHPERAIRFTQNGVEFDDQDAQLLAMKSPAPVDEVANRAWEFVGRYTDVLQTLENEVNHPESTELGAAHEKSQAAQRLEGVRQQLERLKFIAHAAGTVSMQELFKPPYN